MAKLASNQAFLKAKKELANMEYAKENGIEKESFDEEKDAFDMQHHHLLTCLEETTGHEFTMAASIPNENKFMQPPLSTTPLMSCNGSFTSLDTSCCCKTRRNKSQIRHLKTHQGDNGISLTHTINNNLKQSNLRDEKLSSSTDIHITLDEKEADYHGNHLYQTDQNQPYKVIELTDNGGPSHTFTML
ncbi:KCND3 [Bugula neritina]|uniref:KCND3 n=1 Tax=Bugula neritina TaxID=10212 RepID=A0A7J7KL23_BUGNE|nr:KCND3 [Bugula neritina]